MNKFITFENSGETFDYLFTKNHFLLLLVGLVIIIFFSMYISRQKLKFQKAFSIVVLVLIVALEGLRIFWRYKYLAYNGQSLDFINVVNLDYFTLSLWISIPLILIGIILKKKKKHNIFGLSFVFSVATLFAMITLVYPNNVNTNFEFYHCYNLMYALIRSLVATLGFLFAFARWIKTEDFLNLWKAVASLVFFMVACVLIQMLVFPTTNLFYVSYCPLFESLGFYLSSPWHLLLMFAFIFVAQVFLYLPFRIHKAIKYRKH